ncbi:MAG TPA: hypothetical protein VF877_05340 [Gaiellaceae bacterium]
MRKPMRLAVAAGAAVVGLAFAGPAVAAYNPTLIALSTNNAPGRPTTMILGHTQEASEDPTVKDTIYAPPGYGVTLTQPAGTKIGDITAHLILRGAGNAEVDADGQVVTDTQANYTAAATQCTGTPTHEAVWRADITVQGTGTQIQVPIYVDHVVGAEATFATAKLQLCLAGPFGTPNGAQLLFAIFNVNGVFTNPTSTTDRIWRATFTPYAPGTPTPNPAGTTEGQALVPGRVSLSLSVKRLKHRVVILQGRLLIDGQPFRGATVELFVPGKSKPVAKPKTSRTGRYSVRKRIKKPTRYHAEVFFIGALASCPATAIPGVPQGCKTATVSFLAVTKNVLARPRR